MSYTKEDLRKKLIEMYPEIDTYDLSVDLEFEETKNAWIITFKRNAMERHAFLDKGDADRCIEGDACIYLGIIIAQYIKDLAA